MRKINEMIARMTDEVSEYYTRYINAEATTSEIAIAVSIFGTKTGVLPGGDFVRAMCENDFVGAVCRADSKNIGKLRNYATFLTGFVPSEELNELIGEFKMETE